MRERYEISLKTERGLSLTTVAGYWRFIRPFLVERFGDASFFFSSRRRHTRSVSAFLLNRSSDLEYGTANGRLHFHAVHFMRTLPTGSVDPNFGRRVRNRRQLNSLQNTWPYGYSMPIAVRYTQDAFSRSGWLWPVDAKGEPLK